MPSNKIDIAIIGGGIAGLTLALGLLKHTKQNSNSEKIGVTIYEQAHSFREIGAGIGFTPNAERAMRIVDDQIHTGFKRVATQNASDWFQYVDGVNEVGDDARQSQQSLLFRIYLGERAFEGCSRASFLDELAQLAPPGLVEFQKRLTAIVDNGLDKKLLLKFQDGTSHEADAVIGCDGIRSKVRQFLLGPENPASYPHYTHKYAARGLVPMSQAIAALGEHKTSTRFMHLGPNAHALTFPVAMGSLMNVVAFVSDPKPWPSVDDMMNSVEKVEVEAAFKEFGPTVRAIIGLLPENLERWAVFDTCEYPAETFVGHRVALVGDAAHAAAPHHGAGAGFCIEDAAVLCTLLPMAIEAHQAPPSIDTAEILKAVFETYDSIRRNRALWLVESSRIIGEVYEWQYPHVGNDTQKCHDEAYWRSHEIWDYDVDKMVKEAKDVLRRRLDLLGA